MDQHDKATPQKRMHVVVHGLVQGVNFRAYTLHKATSLSLRGWVRNLPDRTVEAVAEGTEADLNTFIRHLQEGPPASQVARVEVTWETATSEFDGFHIAYFSS